MSEIAYSQSAESPAGTVRAALAASHGSVAAWARAHGHDVDLTYRVLSRYAGARERRPIGLDTIAILRDLRRALGVRRAKALLPPPPAAHLLPAPSGITARTTR